jgi:hypothetical protein
MSTQANVKAFRKLVKKFGSDRTNFTNLDVGSDCYLNVVRNAVV